MYHERRAQRPVAALRRPRYHGRDGGAILAIRGLLFDFGGVISDMRWDVARQLEREHGLERGTVFRTLYDSDEWHAVQTGKGDIEAWRASAHARLEQAAGRSLPRLHERWRRQVRLLDDNVRLIRALRPPYRVAVLSNADRTLEERIQDGLGLGDLFDTVVCSAAVGMAKPDHRIYRLAAERVGLPPEECLFVDDLESNVVAAREVGMAGVHHRHHRGDDLAAQLAEFGVRPAA